MGARAPKSPRISLWVAVLVLAAVLLGGAAALLTAPVAPNPPSYFYPGFDITVTEGGWLVIGFVLVWLVYHLYDRRRNGALSVLNRALAPAFVAILLAIGFIILARAFGPTGGGGASPPQGSDQNGTQTASLNNTTNLSVTNTGFEPLHLAGWSIPGWVVFAAILAVAAVVGIVAVPAYLSRKQPVASPRVGPAARTDFADALQRLSSSAEPDVRQVIITLYARLLRRIGPALGDLDAQAPREIELACASSLHIQPATAHALTELFEEARYSTHPLDAATGARAQEVFRQALADLDLTGLRAA